MTEEEELFDEAKRSREETQQLREESGLGRDADTDSPQPESPLPEPSPGEPWAKTSSGDADSITDDD